MLAPLDVGGVGSLSRKDSAVPWAWRARAARKGMKGRKRERVMEISSAERAVGNYQSLT
jgi:hypothetical protein